MFKNYFYNESIKKYTAVFGTLFNEMKYMSNGVEVKLPFRYVPLKRHLEKADRFDDIEDKPARRVVPSMSYQLTGLLYDAERQINKRSKIIDQNYVKGNLTANTQYQRVPYKFNYDLYITTKNFTDMLQIIEQILPHFSPSIDVKISDSPNLNLETSCKITLTSSDLSAVLEGDIESVDELDATFSFEVEGYLYKASNISKVITQADITMFNEANLSIDSVLSTVSESV